MQPLSVLYSEYWVFEYYAQSMDCLSIILGILTIYFLSVDFTSMFNLKIEFLSRIYEADME